MLVLREDLLSGAQTLRAFVSSGEGAVSRGQTGKTITISCEGQAEEDVLQVWEEGGQDSLRRLSLILLFGAQSERGPRVL